MPNIALPTIEDSNLISINASTNGHLSNRVGKLLIISCFFCSVCECKVTVFFSYKCSFCEKSSNIAVS